MPSFKSQDYECDACGGRSIELVERGTEPQPLACELRECAGARLPVWGAPKVLNHTYPDGTRRFANIRASRELAKAVSTAKREGRRDDEKRLRSEKRKVDKSSS